MTNRYHAFKVGDLVDAYGTMKAKEAELSDEMDAMKVALAAKMTPKTPYEGELFRMTYNDDVVSNRFTLKKLAGYLVRKGLTTRDGAEAYCKRLFYSESTSSRFTCTARKGAVIDRKAA